MPILRWLLAVALAAAGACQPARPAACQLTPDELLSRQHISILAVRLPPDTVDLTSGDSLCWQPLGNGDSLQHLPAFSRLEGHGTIYGNQVAAWHFTDGTGDELLTTDTTGMGFSTAILNRHLAAQPQAILKFRIVNRQVVLAQGIRVGMHQQAFINLLFQRLTAEETECLRQRRVFVLGDPVGEYIRSTYSFAGDTLRRITLESPGTFANAQRQSQ